MAKQQRERKRTEGTRVPDPPFARYLFSNTASAWIWLILRVYLGYQWVQAGTGKIGSPVWTGAQAGTVIRGFVAGALEKVSGDHPDVQGWYAAFLQSVVLPNAALFSRMVAYGEVLVGLALIAGFLTGIAAFFGTVLNLSFMLAGAVSTNPVMFAIATWLVLAWKVAGWWGADRYLLPYLGTPWSPGRAFGGAGTDD